MLSDGETEARRNEATCLRFACGLGAAKGADPGSKLGSPVGQDPKAGLSGPRGLSRWPGRCPCSGTGRWSQVVIFYI